MILNIIFTQIFMTQYLDKIAGITETIVETNIHNVLFEK